MARQEVTFDPKSKNVIQQIQFDNLFAFKQDIKDWVSARQQAIDVDLPDWVAYIRVLEDVMTDTHITSVINSTKNKIKHKKFGIFDKAGNINEEKTELFKKEWFLKYMDLVIESIYYPYSLIFLGDMVNFDLDIQLVPREYVTPQWNLVKKSLYTTNNSDNAGWRYTDPELEPYYILSESSRQLGLLDVAAYHALGKKHMLIYWWRYGEIFGVPLRIGKTDIRDPKRRDNMEAMLKDAGNAMYGVLDLDDEIEIKEGEDHDVYQVFENNLKYSNNEISKAFMGAVGITDEKSFVGSAESGERLFDEYIQAHCTKITFNVNNELIPRLKSTYRFPLSEGDEFRFINDQKISFEEKTKVLEILLKNGYSMDEQTVKEEFGLDVEIRETETDSIIRDVNNIYKEHNH